MVPYIDVEFEDQLGRGCRKKKQTQFLEDGQEPVRGRTRVKAGHGKEKAMKNFKKVLQNTTIKEYNNIQEMLNDENLSNEDEYKRMTEIEEIMKMGEKLLSDFRMKIFLLLGQRRTFVSCKVL